LPTAYVTVWPRPGIWLFAPSLIMPSEAVVVRAPEQHPRTMASWSGIHSADGSVGAALI
jgi:hypothetical protein